jgi:hypothetical protein
MEKLFQYMVVNDKKQKGEKKCRGQKQIQTTVSFRLQISKHEANRTGTAEPFQWSGLIAGWIEMVPGTIIIFSEKTPGPFVSTSPRVATET